MTVRVRSLVSNAIAILMATVLVAAGSTRPEKVTRYGSVIGVKPEKLEYYKKLHADPWPVINETLREAHVRNYSIYLTQF